MAKITSTKKLNEQPSTNNGLNQSDYFKELGRLFSGPEKDFFRTGGKVDPKKAELCAQNFEGLMKNVTDHDLFYFRIKHAGTLRVAFTGKDLNNYIKEMVDLGEALVNNIKIVFCIYTADFVSANPSIPKEDTDKLSVFLWPYLNDTPSKDAQGNPLKPYNLGGLQP